MGCTGESESLLVAANPFDRQRRRRWRSPQRPQQYEAPTSLPEHADRPRRRRRLWKPFGPSNQRIGRHASGADFVVEPLTYDDFVDYAQTHPGAGSAYKDSETSAGLDPAQIPLPDSASATSAGTTASSQPPPPVPHGHLPDAELEGVVSGALPLRDDLITPQRPAASWRVRRTRRPKAGLEGAASGVLLESAMISTDSWQSWRIGRTDSPGLPLPVSTPSPAQKSTLGALFSDSLALAGGIIENVLEKAYGHGLFLRIPSLYFSRVARIFEDARTSIPDIQRMARWRIQSPEELMYLGADDFVIRSTEKPLPKSLLHLKVSWEGFIDSLMREWKTLNVVSVLLMSAILTLLQIESASHPITRTTALFSLICALMSLLYGCIYIIRFGTMRKMHKASSFAKAVDREHQEVNIWWNVFVLLALPSTWLAWSILTFLASITSFIWLTGSAADESIPKLSPRAALGVRISLSFVLALGLIYFALVVREFQRYGDVMDREWMRCVVEDLKAKVRMYGHRQRFPPRAPSVRNRSAESERKNRRGTEYEEGASDEARAGAPGSHGHEGVSRQWFHSARPAPRMDSDMSAPPDRSVAEFPPRGPQQMYQTTTPPPFSEAGAAPVDLSAPGPRTPTTSLPERLDEFSATATLTPLAQTKETDDTRFELSVPHLSPDQSRTVTVARNWVQPNFDLEKTFALLELEDSGRVRFVEDIAKAWKDHLALNERDLNLENDLHISKYPAEALELSKSPPPDSSGTTPRRNTPVESKALAHPKPARKDLDVLIQLWNDNYFSSRRLTAKMVPQDHAPTAEDFSVVVFGPSPWWNLRGG